MILKEVKKLNLKISLALALLTMFQFVDVEAAAPIDREIAILASEQPKETPPAKVAESSAQTTPKSKKELEEEEKRLREERRAAEKKLREEKEAARKQIEAGRKEQINVPEDKRNRSTRNVSMENISTANGNSSVESSNAVNAANGNSSVKSSAEIQPVAVQTAPTTGMPNPMVSYASYDELAKAVGFAPLYIPKKSGYTVNELFSINNKIAEIRYGRRWEPEVSLHIRTYKRAPNEELQDISGVQGAKWRVDTSGGTTVYVSKVSDNTNAAAWAVGNYTFSAYVENLSFAAFHTLVIEELVDLTTHYYVN